MITENNKNAPKTFMIKTK